MLPSTAVKTCTIIASNKLNIKSLEHEPLVRRVLNRTPRMPLVKGNKKIVGFRIVNWTGSRPHDCISPKTHVDALPLVEVQGAEARRAGHF